MAVIGVILIIAVLFTFKKVAEVAVDVVSNVTGGRVNPAVEVFQNTAANIGLVAAGLLLFGLSAVVVAGVFKVAVIVAAVAMVGIGLYNLYNLFTGRPSGSPIPEASIKRG